MYNMSDYRAALDERDRCTMDPEAWELAGQKVQFIVESMLAAGSAEMVNELTEEVRILHSDGFELDDEEVKDDIRLLETYGYKEQAQELRELDWR